MGPTNNRDHSPPVIAGIALFTFGALLLPIAASRYPALTDFPVHLARHYIGAMLDRSADLQRFYSYSWRPVPNMAADVLFVPLNAIFSPVASERLIIATIVSLGVVWPFVLHRALWGCWSAAPFLSGLIVYNTSLRGGLENFLLAAAIGMLAFALWISWRDRLSWWRILIFCFIATGVYFGHLLAWAILALCIAAYELQKALGEEEAIIARTGRLALSAVPFLPGLALFFLFGASSRTSGEFVTNYGGLSSRIDVLLSLVMMYEPIPDILALTAVLGILIWHATTSRRPVVHGSIWGVLVALSLVCLLTPAIVQDIRAVHVRLPPILAAILIASIKWRGVTVRQWRLIGAVFIATMTIRSISITNVWVRHDLEIVELRGAFQRLDDGAVLLPTVNPNADTGAFHWFSSAYAVLDRDAFTPVLYPDVQMLSIKPAYARLTQLVVEPISIADLPSPDARVANSARRAAFWATWWTDFSYVLVQSRTSVEPPFANDLELVAAGSFFKLYKIRDR